MNLLNKIPKAFLLQLLPAWVLGITTIILFFTGTIPLYYIAFTIIMWVLSCGLGIAVGYHRVFSHKTHKLPTWKENVILFFATFAGQGGSIFWTALHRGYHHPYSDTIKDFHSPNIYGKINSFFWGYLNISAVKNPVDLRYAIDLLRKKNHVFFHKHNITIMWFVPIIVALFDWKLSLAAFALVAFIGTIQDNLVNVYGHVKAIIGYRNFDTKDKSQNNVILGYLAWGQGWHNNHHYDPKSFDFGTGISNKWWEYDPCRLFLPFLGKRQKL